MSNHNRNITLGDRNPNQPEPKFIHYKSGRVVANIGKFKGIDIREIPEDTLRFYLTFDDLDCKSRRVIEQALSPKKKKPKKKKAKSWREVNKKRKA
tara:strand:- start:11494 stop:11781 length:288 start_codon:yes stop_codon:yes gene_type:complete